MRRMCKKVLFLALLCAAASEAKAEASGAMDNIAFLNGFASPGGARMRALNGRVLPIAETPRGEAALVRDLAGSRGFATLLNARGSNKNIAPDGAVGRNMKSFSDVAAQRGAGYLIMRGIVERNAALVDGGVRALEYAFARQNAAGYFENGRGVAPEKAVEADAFFLQAFARSYLILRDSEYWPQFGARLERLRPNLLRAMSWLSGQSQELLREDRNATNRLWFDAIAFTLSGMILDDHLLVQIGEDFIGEGLRRQQPDGSFIEHGGFDTSYQAVSIINVEVLLVYASNTQMASRLHECLMRALAWERPRIRPDGSVEIAGNARTGLGQETFLGQPKEVNYPEVALALFYASAITRDQDLLHSAEAVVEYAARMARP
jgi:hypothetical protein